MTGRLCDERPHAGFPAPLPHRPPRQVPSTSPGTARRFQVRTRLADRTASGWRNFFAWCGSDAARVSKRYDFLQPRPWLIGKDVLSELLSAGWNSGCAARRPKAVIGCAPQRDTRLMACGICARRRTSITHATRMPMPRCRTAGVLANGKSLYVSCTRRPVGGVHCVPSPLACSCRAVLAES